MYYNTHTLGLHSFGPLAKPKNGAGLKNLHSVNSSLMSLHTEKCGQGGKNVKHGMSTIYPIV